MPQELPSAKHHPALSPTSPRLCLSDLTLSPPLVHRTAQQPSLIPHLSFGRVSERLCHTEDMIRPFLNPFQAAAIDVPHKCIALPLPKTYRSYKRGRYLSIVPKMTFAPFPKKLQHKLEQRWAAKESSFVPVMLEEKNNCWLSISQQEQLLWCQAKRICTSLYFFVDSYDLLFSESVFLYYGMYQKSTIV